jgi:hypothetical protein
MTKEVLCDIDSFSASASHPSQLVPSEVDYVLKAGPDETNKRHIRENLTAALSRKVGFWKFVVVTFILLTAVCVVAGTYIFLSASERNAVREAVSVYMYFP